MKRRVTVVAALALATIGARAAAAEPPRSRGAAEHAAITRYEGTRTCGACHAKSVHDVVRSLHYQQQGPTPFLTAASPAKSAGMMVSY